MSMNNYIKEMLLALEANIEYLKQEGGSQLKVKNGQLINNIDDIYIYEFELEFFQEIEPDTEIDIRVKNENVSGRVLAINDKNVQVGLDKNIGPSIPEAWLIISNYYLLQLLYDKLKKVDNGELKLTDLPEKTFNLKPALVGLEEYLIPPSQTNLPNESQEKAIKLTLGSEVSFIWGPPGTGKTQTIARIIEGFLDKNLSTLLISHTNAATDGALLNVVKHLESKDEYRDGRILREGTIQNDELNNQYDMVKPEIVLEKKGFPIKNEIEVLKRHIDEISLTTSKSEGVIKQFHKIEALKKEEENIKSDIANKEVEVDSAKYKLKDIEIQLEDTENKIHEYQSKGTLMKFISGSNMETLTRKKSSLLIDKDKESQKVFSHTRIIADAQFRLQGYIEQRKAIENNLEGENLEKHKKTVEQAELELRNLKEQRDLLIKQLEELATTLIKDAKVIATTLTKSYSSQVVLNREYDCVVIDEASMAPLPALWCASGLAKHKVVIVGDFYQLPPIAKHKVLRSKEKSEEEIKKEEALVEKWLKKDIFDVSGILSKIRSGIKPEGLEQLNFQYRMHPDIASVVNLLVYGKSGKQFELISADNTYNNGIELLHQSPLENAHIGIYDTGKIGSLPNRTDSGSYYNLYQALLAVGLAKQALDNGYKSIGIISPFRPQSNLIQKIVRDKNLGESIQADTVHRFQGDEKQLIIFDTTTPQPTKLTDDQEEGGDDEKLLNVAFSRAKEKCIIIADIQAIEKKHSLTSLLRKLIQLCRDKNFPIISSENSLPKYLASEQSEQWLKHIYNIDALTIESENSQLFSQIDFYPNFIKDLFNAKQEVVIDSPYITRERVSFFIPIFKHLISKEIRIFILTRQPKEHDAPMKYHAEDEIKKFESMGITVLPFIGNIHRKLAIIDRSILWEGSLNILSQRASHEIMRRFEGQETANQVMTFLKLDKNIGHIGENKFQRCEFCTEPGAWYWTDKSIYGGLWTFCLVGGHKSGTKPKSKTEINNTKKRVKRLRKAKKKRTGDGAPICPDHDIPMIKRMGRFGQFWGCIKYPSCKITHKIN